MTEPKLSFTTECHRPGRPVGPCMTSGSLEAAEDYARYLAKDCGVDPAVVHIKIDGLCGDCDGSGRRPKHRRRRRTLFVWASCKHCEGVGIVEIAAYRPLVEVMP